MRSESSLLGRMVQGARVCSIGGVQTRKLSGLESRDVGRDIRWTTIPNTLIYK